MRTETGAKAGFVPNLVKPLEAANFRQAHDSAAEIKLENMAGLPLRIC
jgi:hypothetical protein